MNRHTWPLAALCAVGLYAITCPMYAPAEAAEPVAPVPTVGLAVQPGGLLIQDVIPGRLYDLEEKTGIALTVYNRDNREHSYTLSTHRPSEVGNRRVPSGYTDIIDPSWLWFDKTEICVPALGHAKVRMYLKIPGTERYLNQHWSVSVGVVGKPEPGDMLRLAVYPRFEIETAVARLSKCQLRGSRSVQLGPTVLVFVGLRPGTRQRSEFVLCNSDEREHRYRFETLSRGEVSEGRGIHISGGFRWMPDPNWVRTRWPDVTVSAHQVREVPVQVRLPAGLSTPIADWEQIISVRRDDGETGFVRVRVKQE